MIKDMNDLVIISADDHVCEPPDLWEKHTVGEARETMPRFCTDENGKNYWEYMGKKYPSVGLNAVVGRPFEEYGMEPTSLADLRKGCYDVHARIDDMDVNGIAASLCFGNSIAFNGRVFNTAPNKKHALAHIQAYNDWQIDEWCAAYPGRFIPLAILPLWDPEAAAAEIKRVSDKGCHCIAMTENPTVAGLPSIHNDYWKPLWKAVADYDMTINLHIGTGNPQPHASLETPIEAWITTMPMSVAVGAADWLHLKALQEYPNMRIVLNESGIGWIPYFLERADFSNWRHKVWTHSIFQDRKPSEVFREHFLVCFVDDHFGLKNLDAIGEDNVAYECDYPHSDSLWPEVPEYLWPSIQHLTEEQIEKITHRNAMRFFRFDPFRHHKREELTVGALRARAKARGVDTTPVSMGGSKPLEGEVRPVTSGDLMRMMAAHAEREAEAKSA
ncbi:MAG: amidohydrolase [Porticoccaceae bacterium]|nr:MAG: amidohydrolase [Porticoccaceae bacterium]